MLFTFLFGCIFLKKVADLDVEVRQKGGFFSPGLKSVHVRKGDDITRLQDVEAFVELAFATGGRSQGRIS